MKLLLADYVMRPFSTVSSSLLVILSCAGTFGLACSSTPAGAEGGTCYANNTCDPGLSCLSALCVGDGDSSGDDGGSGGASGVPIDGSGGTATGGVGSGGKPAGSGGTPIATGGSGTGGTQPTGPGPELIANGSFNGIANWSISLNSGSGTYSSYGEQLCFTANSSQNLAATLGVPVDVADAFDMEAGSYTLSYRISGNGEGEVKVGLAETPYTTVQSYAFSSFQSEYVESSKVFNVPVDRQNVGLAINFIVYGEDEYSTYTLCFDDISLHKN